MTLNCFSLFSFSTNHISTIHCPNIWKEQNVVEERPTQHSLGIMRNSAVEMLLVSVTLNTQLLKLVDSRCHCLSFGHIQKRRRAQFKITNFSDPLVVC